MKFSNKSFTPAPRAGHSCTKMNENQVILFGGRSSTGRLNDLYVINLPDLSCSKKYAHFC